MNAEWYSFEIILAPRIYRSFSILKIIFKISLN